MAITYRPVEEGDYEKGFVGLLAELTTVGDITEEMFRERLAEIQGGAENVFVVEDTESGKLLATGSLLIERKFIHQCGRVGHIEDVVVEESARGMGVGKMIIANLIDEARERGCYKVILDCSEENVAFYEKQEFAKKDVHMAIYFE